MNIRLFSRFTILLFIMATVFGIQSCRTQPKAIDPSELEGYWVLKSINGKEAKTVFTGALPTLIFDFKEMRISGTDGCNSYAAGFAFEKNILSPSNIVATQMLCLGDTPEHNFFAELGRPNTLSIENGILILTDKDNTSKLEFQQGQAPAKTGESITTEQLLGTWNLKKMDGQDAVTEFKSDEGLVPSLTFIADNSRITGNSGCNTYNSAFRIENNMLIIEPVMTTRMACPNMAKEVVYLRNLADTSSVSFSSPDELVFTKNGKTVLEFEKSAE